MSTTACLLIFVLSCSNAAAYPRPISAAHAKSAALSSRFGALGMAGAGLFGGLFGGGKAAGAKAAWPGSATPTNEVVKVVNGIRHKRLGSGDLVVSELGLGTQRWVSEDFNAPSKDLCFAFLDKAVASGVNHLDTAEQYPIPSGPRNPEGKVEEVIGEWMAKSPGRRSELVISTKITGGRNVNRKNIFADCEGSLRRMKTDYIDVYMLHWPARYTPQSNWGQSLQYNYDVEKYYEGNAGFEEIALAMGDLIKQGKIRGWGLCNDNAFGLTSCCEVAKRLGVPGIVAMQNDYSLIDRRAEENGVSEASSPIHENVGFQAYNVLAGGVLAGTYLDGPPPPADNPNLASSMAQRTSPRGRHDETGWGRTLYRYRSGPANEATVAYAAIAKKYGISLLELSLRWAAQRRPVTTCLLGATSMKQFEDQLRIFKKATAEPLPEQLMWDIDVVHMRNRLPIFASTRVGKDWYGEGEIGESIP